MTSVSARIIIMITILVTGCGPAANSSLQHIDNPDSRGSMSTDANPWHFHTGKGYVITDLKDQNQNLRVVSNCPIDPNSSLPPSPDCREKVYYFSPDEVNILKNQALTQRQSQFNYSTTSTSVAVGATVTSAVLAGATLGTGVLALVVVWQGYDMASAYNQIRKLDQLMVQEKAFVNRCQHLSKDFLERASALGMQFMFNEDGGTYIPADEYLKAAKEEDKLYDATIDYARKKGITTQQAYSEYFLNQCGQLPMTTMTKSDKLFAAKWANIPENLKSRTLEISQAVLGHSRSIEYANFDGNDFDSLDEQVSMINFLTRLRQDVSNIEKYGNAGDQKNLQWFRDTYQHVVIRPRWSGFDTFSSDYKSWETATIDNQNYLFINAIWSATSRSYNVTMRDFFVQKLLMNPAIFDK